MLPASRQLTLLREVGDSGVVQCHGLDLEKIREIYSSIPRISHPLKHCVLHIHHFSIVSTGYTIHDVSMDVKSVVAVVVVHV